MSIFPLRSMCGSKMKINSNSGTWLLNNAYCWIYWPFSPNYYFEGLYMLKGTVIEQLVAQHCCVASCRVNVAYIATLTFVVWHCWHKVEVFFYSLVQHGELVALGMVIQFTLQFATQQCCTTSCTILLFVLPYLYVFMLDHSCESNI